MDLGSAAQEWQTHGFVVLPGFVPAAELKPAIDELPTMYPTAEGFHDGTDERRGRFTVDEWAGIDNFPFRSAELSLLAVSDRVIDLAETLLADRDLRLPRRRPRGTRGARHAVPYPDYGTAREAELVPRAEHEPVAAGIARRSLTCRQGNRPHLSVYSSPWA